MAGGHKAYRGKLRSEGCKIALIAGRFNGFVVEQLVAGAIDALIGTGARESDISVYWCPGSFEIPQVARRVVERGGFDAVICLGAVIRGATPHFDHVASAVSRGVAQLATTAAIPVTFAVLTTDTIEQAIERAGTKAGNKGYDAAMAAVEMMNLYREIEK